MPHRFLLLSFLLAAVAQADDAIVSCSNQLPRAEYSPVFPAHNLLFNLPLKQRLLEVTAFDPRHAFDSGDSPYLALELPAYQQPYRVELASQVEGGKVFAPTVQLLDGEGRATRCFPSLAQTLQSGDSERLPALTGGFEVSESARNERYVLIYTTRADAEASTRDNTPYQESSLVSGIAQLNPWAADAPPDAAAAVDYPHSYYGRLTLRLKNQPR